MQSTLSDPTTVQCPLLPLHGNGFWQHRFRLACLGLLLPLLGAQAALDPLHRDSNALGLRISDSFSRATVNAANHGGGLIGQLGDGTVLHTYSAGSVAAQGIAGGLIGSSTEASAVTGSYWDGPISGQAFSAGGEARDTATMTDPPGADTYLEWDFVQTWAPDVGALLNAGYPLLRDYTPSRFTLVLSVIPAGAGWTSGSGTYPAGTVVTATAFHMAGFAFQHWLEGAAVVSANASYSFALDANRALTAVFSPIGGGDPDFAGGSGTAADPFRIADARHFDNIRHHPDAHFRMIADVVLSALPGLPEEGWLPIAPVDEEIPFTGTLDGAGFAVRNLVINRPESDFQGLFGLLGDGAVIRNLGIEGGSISGLDGVGAIAAYAHESTLERCYATADVRGNSAVGGLIGVQDGGRLTDSFSSGNVTGQDNAVGGLIGYQIEASLERSYASGAVSGLDAVGGLIGLQDVSIVRNCFAAGTVSGGNFVGGLVGLAEGEISHAYARGRVTGHLYVGGLIGGLTEGSVTASYWDTSTTGQSESDGGTGLVTAALTFPYAAQAYGGWDFTHTWAADPERVHQGYPWLPSTHLRTWDRGSTAMDQGWRWSPWFGFYAWLAGDWYWHSPHGALYVPKVSHPDSIYLYAQDLHWLWTASDVYPWFYRFNDRAWIYYFGGTRNPRWFLNQITGTWEQWP